MIFAIRHGERIDDPSVTQKLPHSIISFDPPLSKNGKMQAKATGDFLDNYIHYLEIITNRPKNITILTSPFLRCVQTAAQISKKIKDFKKNRIYVCDEVCEILKTKFYDRNVIPELLVKQSHEKEVKIREKINLKHKKLQKLICRQSKIHFPENIDQCCRRFKSAVIDIYSKFINSIDDVVIVVTHSIGMQCILYNMEPEREIPQVKYCAITQILYTKRNRIFDFNEGKLGIRNYRGHLEEEEESGVA